MQVLAASPHPPRAATASRWWACVVLGLAGCSGSSGGADGSGVAGPFRVSGTNVAPSAVWELNRAIEITFDRDLDFSSVSSNTIQVRSDTGVPAVGTFSLAVMDTDGDGTPESVDARRLVFTPTCPTNPDLSDAGLQPGGVSYVLEIPGRSSGAANVVRARDGRALEEGFTTNFETPLSSLPSELFRDPLAGPALPVLRPTGSQWTAATRFETGDGAVSVYVEFDLESQTPQLSQPGFEAPLNPYHDDAQRLSLVIEFDQPISPAAANLARLGLEVLEDGGSWRAITTRVDLEANCRPFVGAGSATMAGTGARVRLEAFGVFPRAGRLRAVVRSGFQDLVGEALGSSLVDFAEIPVRSLDYASLQPRDAAADELLESFDLGGPELPAFEDDSALTPYPRADWGGGMLRSSTGFDGTGGPGGDFDWIVPTGAQLIVDTDQSEIVGGPGGVPTAVQLVQGGVFQVRDWTLEEGATLRVQGSRPLVVKATGDVTLRGELILDGFAAKNVGGLGGANLPALGGAGAAGGGRGGDGSHVLTTSTPRGGAGFGPHPALGAQDGGQGGESGFALEEPPHGKDARRPGGGGGGRFARDQGVFFAEDGYDGHPAGRGGVTGLSPARGGASGRGPFIDGDPENDYFGLRAIVDAEGNVVAFQRGELPSLWGGYGGGAGGDASPFDEFPSPSWFPTSDEKGGGGGGGAGALRILALGRIVIAPSALVRGRGGKGAIGENTAFHDHVGGSGGSGSGGHLVLESAREIDFTDGDPDAPSRFALEARGGPTIVGEKDSENGPVPCGISHGGQGGPGVIQLHVPESTAAPGSDPSTTNLVVPRAALLAADPLAELCNPAPVVLLPSVASRSRARSTWIPLGSASEPAGSVPLAFFFDGVAPDGSVATEDERVKELAPLGEPTAFGAGAELEPDGTTLRLMGGALQAFAGTNDLYLRSPLLLRGFFVRIEAEGLAGFRRSFDVLGANYDDERRILRLELALSEGGTALDFVEQAGALASPTVSLIPRFFRVTTGGQRDLIGPDAYVRIQFQGASEDELGRPGDVLVDWTADPSAFEALTSGTLRFVRFRVDFELDRNDAGNTAAALPLTLEFLRLPFRY